MESKLILMHKLLKNLFGTKRFGLKQYKTNKPSQTKTQFIPNTPKLNILSQKYRTKHLEPNIQHQTIKQQNNICKYNLCKAINVNKDPINARQV